ncbi:MAG TPA: hypothetical protein VI039_12860 [Solirubrobacterales bacterium]
MGFALKGATDVAIPITSKADFVSKCGARTSWNALLYDTVDISFDQGLNQAYFVRVVGPEATTAKKVLVNSGSEETLEAVAASAGEGANSIKVEVLAGVAGSFKLRVYEGETLVESSPELVDNAAAVIWAAESSALITLKDLGKGDPKVQSVTLAGGDDDREGVDDKVIAAALALFSPDLGKGQVAVPGNTAEAVQLAVIAHCDETERNPFLDAEDAADYEDVIAQALALRSADGARQAAIFDGWDIAKGDALATTRTVPPVARQLGAVAAVDAQTGNASEPAAGENGKARVGGLVIGLARTRTDAEREALNDAGVNVSIIEDGVPTTFGWRTLADPFENRRWLALNVARVMTGIAHDAKNVLKRRLFKKIDAQGKAKAAAKGDIENDVLKPLYTAEALYGATEAEAFTVNVTQNTDPSDGAIAKLEAEIGAAPVEFAEQIPLTVVATN